MSQVTLITTPDFLSPLNAEVWFNSTANWSNLPSFKYVYKVRQIDPSSSTILDEMGQYLIPPSPDGDSWFSPNKILRTKFDYYISNELGTYQTDPNSYIKYQVQYGLSTDLVFPYYDELFSGGFVSLTFSYQHGFTSGMVIDVMTNGDVNPTYNSTASITTVNAYQILTNIPWVNAGPVIGGNVRIPYYDVFYSSTPQGTLGITFSGTHFFLPGDIITIDKTNKSFNIEYDGTASVVSIGTRSISVNKEFLGTQSEGLNGGFISKIQRFSATSSACYGYNGTRQYDEVSRNFGLSYSMSSDTITSNGLTAAGFLTTYDRWKEVPNDAYEISSFFIKAGSGLIRLEMKAYDDQFNQVNIVQATFSYGYSQAFMVGTGPENVRDIFGPNSLNGATFYEVYLIDTSSS